MRLEDYAAQQQHEAQEVQKPQQAGATPLDYVAAKLDAEKLFSLKVMLSEAIEEEAAPAQILRDAVGALFGENSRQAAAVETLISRQQMPGGYEKAIADIRQRKSLLKRELKQLQEQAQATQQAIKDLEECDRALQSERGEAAGIDAGLTAVLAFYKQLEPEPQPSILRDAAELYKQHGGNSAAMGLLYGVLIDAQRKAIGGGKMDLIEQREYSELKDQIETAIKR